MEGERERECSKASPSLHEYRWGGDTDRACHRPQFKSNLRHDRVSWLLAAPPFPLIRPRLPLLRLLLLLLLQERAEVRISKLASGSSRSPVPFSPARTRRRRGCRSLAEIDKARGGEEMRYVLGEGREIDRWKKLVSCQE